MLIILSNFLRNVKYVTFDPSHISHNITTTQITEFAVPAHLWFSHSTAFLVLVQSEYDVGLPMLVLGGLGTLTGLLSFMLPETLDQPMPETLAELENTA